MADPVSCGECGVRYDPDVNKFCPRCGSTARGAAVAPALDVARRHDPGRRRVQASGAVLAVVGALLGVPFLFMLFFTSTVIDSVPDAVIAQDPDAVVPGGTLELTVLRGGVPVDGAAVEIRTPGGTLIANGSTDAVGRLNQTLAEHAFVNVTLLAAEGNFSRHVASLPGSATRVTVDVESDAQDVPGWIGLDKFRTGLIVLLSVFLVIATLLVAAGVSALRLRAWGFAVTGGALGALPALVLFVASLSLGMLLVLLVLGAPLVLIARGRRYFVRPALPMR